MELPTEIRQSIYAHLIQGPKVTYKPISSQAGNLNFLLTSRSVNANATPILYHELWVTVFQAVPVDSIRLHYNSPLHVCQPASLFRGPRPPATLHIRRVHWEFANSSDDLKRRTWKTGSLQRAHRHFARAFPGLEYVTLCHHGADHWERVRNSCIRIVDEVLSHLQLMREVRIITRRCRGRRVGSVTKTKWQMRCETCTDLDANLDNNPSYETLILGCGKRR